MSQVRWQDSAATGRALAPSGRLFCAGPPRALTATFLGIEDRLAHPHRCRGHLDALVVGAELQGLLEAEQARRDQPLEFLTSRLADIGELLLLGDVDIHVV